VSALSAALEELEAAQEALSEAQAQVRGCDAGSAKPGDVFVGFVSGLSRHIVWSASALAGRPRWIGKAPESELAGRGMFAGCQRSIHAVSLQPLLCTLLPPRNCTPTAPLPTAVVLVRLCCGLLPLGGV
jgi:hypothetical protein